MRLPKPPRLRQGPGSQMPSSPPMYTGGAAPAIDPAYEPVRDQALPEQPEEPAPSPPVQPPPPAEPQQPEQQVLPLEEIVAQPAQDDAPLAEPVLPEAPVIAYDAPVPAAEQPAAGQYTAPDALPAVPPPPPVKPSANPVPDAILSPEVIMPPPKAANEPLPGNRAPGESGMVDYSPDDIVSILRKARSERMQERAQRKQGKDEGKEPVSDFQSDDSQSGSQPLLFSYSAYRQRRPQLFIALAAAAALSILGISVLWYSSRPSPTARPPAQPVKEAPQKPGYGPLQFKPRRPAKTGMDRQYRVSPATASIDDAVNAMMPAYAPARIPAGGALAGSAASGQGAYQPERSYLDS